VVSLCLVIPFPVVTFIARNLFSCFLVCFSITNLRWKTQVIWQPECRGRTKEMTRTCPSFGGLPLIQLCQQAACCNAFVSSRPPRPVLNEKCTNEKRDSCPLTPLTTPQSTFHCVSSSFLSKQEKHCSDRSRVISLRGSLFTKSVCRSVLSPFWSMLLQTFLKKKLSTNSENSKKKKSVHVVVNVNRNVKKFFCSYV
jgi:hypothetical protein